MIIDILKNAGFTWRKIAKLATPLDSDKPVVIGTKPRQGDLEAYTDDKKIYINVDEKKFRKNFEDIIIPAYNASANRLYSLSPPIPTKELLTNLVFDNFLFVHFHEQLHPWLCPNSKYDEKKINKALYEGIRKTEPSLSKAETMMKVNNSKNLIWDSILNISFLSKTAGYNNDDLEQKIGYIFSENGRKIELQAITHYPQGILPILYIISANNRTTDIPISLIGGMYSTMSFNTSDIRQRAIKFFIEDLKSKKIPETETMEIIKKMYKGFVSEIDAKELNKRSVDKDEFIKRISHIDNLTNSNYEDNQKYFISALTKIFDAPSLRYDSLKGFIKVLSQYISLTQKQGSPDPNTKGSEESEGSRDKTNSDEKSQDEMDKDSMAQTLDDLLGELDKKEADDLMEDVANSAGSGKKMKSINILAADEYYKRNADVIEIRNPSEDIASFDLGNRKRWKLISSKTLTSAEVSRLNHQKIIAFQKSTGLPVLLDVGRGFFKFNHYITEETPLKSYNFHKTGIEIPDNWVIIQDSSGTMTGHQEYVGTKNRFDLLNRVKYGLMKGLYKVCKEMKKDLKFGVVNFSEDTLYKGLDSFIKVYESRSHPIKEISLVPQCGGTEIKSSVFGKIQKELAPGKSICTFITDGEIQGDTDSLYKEIEKFASKPKNAFVFGEIVTASDFGKEIKTLSKQYPSVVYYHVSNIQSIKDKLSSVLIKYG